jgi:hypothetical protein
MKTVSLVVLALLAWASSASAQVVYEPVRYQYGPNVYYGGTNPSFGNSAYSNLPPGLQSAAPVAGAGAGLPGVSSSYLYGSPSGTYPSLSMGTPQPTVHVYSDALPYQEASQYGYTPDDARNEAYANVPRVQYGQGPVIPVQSAAPAPETAVKEPEKAAPAMDPKQKAIPLLSWAKAERTRNPELYKAIMDEARKCDPVATDKMEQVFATEK